MWEAGCRRRRQEAYELFLQHGDEAGPEKRSSG
jgi:hypothetical protein